MSHTLRFSAFIAMVMLSFALAFYAVFHTCGAGSVEPDCGLDDAFGTFGNSLVTVYASALGGPDFAVFDEVGRCGCELPDAARTGGISLMVVSKPPVQNLSWSLRRPGVHEVVTLTSA